jgi:hypothetical protein
MCAVAGGAALVNGTLVDVARSQFTYTPAICSYASAFQSVHFRQVDDHDQSYTGTS